MIELLERMADVLETADDRGALWASLVLSQCGMAGLVYEAVTGRRL